MKQFQSGFEPHGSHSHDNLTPVSNVCETAKVFHIRHHDVFDKLDQRSWIPFQSVRQ